MEIIEPAPAKINLALHVRRRRPDGYHDIETLFAFCRDGDVVRVATAKEDAFAIEGPFADALKPSFTPAKAGTQPPNLSDWAPASAGVVDSGNLVVRAAAAFMAAFGVTRAHAITLTKNLPIASGVGGGSADAAATLRALARIHAVAPEEPRLLAIAADLGADVPACLAGRTALGLGRGDALSAIAGASGAPVLLVNPGVAVSTAAVFAGWDGEDRGGIESGPLLIRARAGRNDLEPAARAVAPVIADVRALLDAARGVLLARMSGSGATCFALFDTEARRARAAEQARARGWWCLETALA